MSDPPVLDVEPAVCCSACLEESASPSILRFSFMILCVFCGNKRCPKALNHRFLCTGSNDTDQFMLARF